MNRRPLVLVEYDPSWPERYERERRAIEAALGENVLEIHHIGSTAVAELLSKPVIDVLVGLRRLELTADETAAMAALGYESLGEYGIPYRRYFRRRSSCHVHAFRLGEGRWRDHLMLRDYLRANLYARDRYAAAKLEIAERVGWDLDRYVEEKERVVAALLREAARVP